LTVSFGFAIVEKQNSSASKDAYLLNGPALKPDFISVAILSKGMDSKMQAPVLSDAKRLVEFIPKFLTKDQTRMK